MSANNCLFVTQIDGKFYGFDTIAEEPAEQITFTSKWAALAADSLEEACLKAVAYCAKNEVEYGFVVDQRLASR